MKLRDYQTNLIIDTRSSIKTGHKRILCVLPCGAGKTVCFAFMAQRHKGYVWFLVHRQELIDQTIDTFNRFGIDMSNVYIGMVGTALRKAPRDPTMIIFDEAHHCTAKTWQNIISAYPQVYIIGLTATPCRLDGTGLGNIFEDMVIGPTSEELTKMGYLVPYEYYAPNVNIMLPKMRGSDYDISEIEYESRIYGDVKQYIDTKHKTIIYCPNIPFSLQLAHELQAGGIDAVHFDGNTPDKDRHRIINDFRNGKIRVLLNVNLIGEGFDVPDCDCCILLRPTMSLALFIQQSMRCLRPAQDKKAIIYDLVGNCYRHGLPTDTHEWSLNGKHHIHRDSEEDVISRQCCNCYRVYSGNARICPYCHQDNGKTKKQIEIEEKAELERIEKINKKKARMQVGMAQSYEALVELAKQRGYKNPSWWAKMILKARRDKI